MNQLFDVNESSSAPEDANRKQSKRKVGGAKSAKSPKFAKSITAKEATIEQLRELANGDDVMIAKEAKELLDQRLRALIGDDRPFDPSVYAYYEDVVGE